MFQLNHRKDGRFASPKMKEKIDRFKANKPTPVKKMRNRANGKLKTRRLSENINL